MFSPEEAKQLLRLLVTVMLIHSIMKLGSEVGSTVRMIIGSVISAVLAALLLLVVSDAGYLIKGSKITNNPHNGAPAGDVVIVQNADENTVLTISGTDGTTINKTAFTHVEDIAGAARCIVWNQSDSNVASTQLNFRNDLGVDVASVGVASSTFDVTGGEGPNSFALIHDAESNMMFAMLYDEVIKWKCNPSDDGVLANVQTVMQVSCDGLIVEDTVRTNDGFNISGDDGLTQNQSYVSRITKNINGKIDAFYTRNLTISGGIIIGIGDEVYNEVNGT